MVCSKTRKQTSAKDWALPRPEGKHSLGLHFQRNRPHKALPRSALLEKHPVRRVGGAEGGGRNRVTPMVQSPSALDFPAEHNVLAIDKQSRSNL
jgi:hypothetical protein